MAIPFFVGQPPLGVPFTLNQASPQARGLVAWWPALGGAPTRLYNRFVGRYHGTMSGTVTLVPRPVVGLMHDFDGSSRFEIDGSSGSNTGLGGIYPTISCWVEFDTTSGTQTIIKRDVDWILRADGGNVQWLVWSSVGGLAVTNFLAFSTGTLYHLACSYDGANMLMYVNGQLVSTTAKTGTPNDFGSTSCVGAQPGGGENIDGRIADLRVYNRPLSAAEVLALYLPQTRWELYAPLWGPVYKAPAAASVPKFYYHLQQQGIA